MVTIDFLLTCGFLLTIAAVIIMFVVGIISYFNPPFYASTAYEVLALMSLLSGFAALVIYAIIFTVIVFGN